MPWNEQGLCSDPILAFSGEFFEERPFKYFTFWGYSMSLIEGKTVLITGGTGSFGKKFTEIVLREYHPKKLIIFSRDELKQHEMRRLLPG